MIIKHADDKTKRIALLEQLRQSDRLDRRQRDWIDQELVRTRRGIEGERDAAHYLDTYHRDAKNHVVLHDLRISVEGEVAQIDHLVISRAFHFYLLETKNFSGNLIVNEHGEFTVEYGRTRFGIPSPLEQSRRHEQVLGRLLDRLGITGRTQARPTFQHIVMVSPRSTITRPKTAAFDTSTVIKADQFVSWRDKYADRMGVGAVLGSVLNLRSLETVREWGEMLKRQHRPADPLALPEFMRPRGQPAPEPEPPAAPSPALESGRRDVFPSAEAPQRKLVCATCGSKISFAEGKYCWNNPARFGGLQYCRQHQAALP